MRNTAADTFLPNYRGLSSPRRFRFLFLSAVHYCTTRSPHTHYDCSQNGTDDTTNKCSKRELKKKKARNTTRPVRHKGACHPIGGGAPSGGLPRRSTLRRCSGIEGMLRTDRCEGAKKRFVVLPPPPPPSTLAHTPRKSPL